jgi:hypothetical protein
MSDAELVFLILAGFYLAECTCWIRTGMVVFSSQLCGRLRGTNLGAAILRNPSGGVVPANLLPCGEACICQQWPLSLSPEGAYSFVSQALSSEGRPAQPERFIRYGDIRHIEASGHELRINGAVFARVAMPAFGRRLARLLGTLRDLPAEAREPAIEGALAEHLDAHLVAGRLALFRAVTAELQLTCLTLFALVFVLLPLLIWYSSELPFLALAGCYLGLVFLTVLQFHHGHRLLYPEEKWERFKNCLLVFFSPVDAIHARDKLARPLLGEFSPLAVVQTAGSPEAFARLAAHAWRDLEFPMLPVCPTADADPQKTEAWFRACLRGQLGHCLRLAGLDLSRVVETPVPDDAHCRSYCPRCLGQYILVSGECSDCGGQPLVPLKPGLG